MIVPQEERREEGGDGLYESFSPEVCAALSRPVGRSAHTSMSEINRADLWVGSSLSVCVTAEMSLNKSNTVRQVNLTSWSKTNILFPFGHHIYIK